MTETTWGVIVVLVHLQGIALGLYMGYMFWRVK